MAPEVITMQTYSCASDIWGIGITAFEMAKGEPPLYNFPPLRAMFLITQSDPPRLTTDNFSESFKDFVDCCLCKEPADRSTTEQLLAHNFINSAKPASTALIPLLERHTYWKLCGKQTSELSAKKIP